MSNGDPKFEVGSKPVVLDMSYTSLFCGYGPAGEPLFRVSPLHEPFRIGQTRHQAIQRLLATVSALDAEAVRETVRGSSVPVEAPTAALSGVLARFDLTTARPIPIAVPSLCPVCNGMVAKGEMAQWVRAKVGKNSALLHQRCYETAQGTVTR